MELREKLRGALGVEQRGVPTRQQRRRTARLGPVDTLGLRTSQSRRGTVHWLEATWPPDYCHGKLRLGAGRTVGDVALRRLAPGISSAQLTDAAFFDVETTGLAGGTGTYVFLVGIGAFEEDSFVVRQFFLTDPSNEPAMLEAVADALAGRSALVSFNGRRFDLPLILTRLTLNRLRPPQHGEHIDLLYPARRLYRSRLESCALKTLETSVLGMNRNGDIPGSLAPSIYFDYLRTGDAAPLRAVFEHNALDILSLVTLLGHLGKVCQGMDAEAEDYLALGRWDEYEGRLAEAAAMFEAALRRRLTVEQRSDGRRRLASTYKRLGHVSQAISGWQVEAEHGTTLGRAEALVELAKVNEHRLRNYGAAESCTRRALALADAAGASGYPVKLRAAKRSALEHRLERLARRQARSNAH